MLISVIIPAYNVEQYLRQCVDSVLAQTYQNIEIIIVDDGSMDGTGILADEIAGEQIGCSISVIHKQNGGLSDARNVGLKYAKGDYVAFLDADDYYDDSQLFEKLVLELCKYSFPNVLLFCRKDFYENINVCHQENPYDIEVINAKETPIEVFAYLLTQQRFNMSACFQLVERNILMHNNIQFVKGLRNEDIDWSIQLWRKIQSVKATNIFGYVYRHRSNSITTTMSIEDVTSYHYMFNKWENVLDPHCANDLLFLKYIAFIFPTIIYNYYYIPYNQRRKAYHLIEDMSSMLKYASTPKVQRVALCVSWLGLKLTIVLFGFYGYIIKPIVRYLLK